MISWKVSLNEFWLLLLQYIWGFPGGSDSKVSACNTGDSGSIPGSGRPPGEGNGNPLQHSSGKSHGQKSHLIGYSPWGHKESDMTERLHFHFLRVSMKVKVLVTHSCLTLCNQVPLSMEFSRQEYWSGDPCPSPGNPPNPGIKPGSPAWPGVFHMNFGVRPGFGSRLHHLLAIMPW